MHRINKPCFQSCLKWSTLLLFFFLPFFLSAQTNSNIPAQLLEVLTDNIKEGDKIALRDLGKLYDKNPQDQRVQDILRRHTLFTKAEWNWASSSKKKSFTSYFYQIEASLRFSELLRVFYLSPIEERTTTVKILPKSPIQIDPFLIRKRIQQIEQYLHKKEVANLLLEIDRIGAINNPTISVVLRDLINKKEILKLKEAQKKAIFSKILDNLPDSLALEQLLILTKKEVLPFDYCQHKLANLSNNFFPVSSHQELVVAYNKLRSSFENNLSVIKEYGYKKMDLTPLLFFEEKVDYFGWMLATVNDSLFWIQRNALADMLNTHHPRALFYTVGLQFKAWKAGNISKQQYLKILENHIDVEIKNKDNPEGSQKTEDNQLNFLIYWASHYEDYQWDNLDDRFVNKQLFSNELENYDRYFRRLNSSNDSIAEIAFAFLCEGKPNEIQRLIKKFKPLLRNYNASLPPLKYKILEQTSLLSYFCKQNNFKYHPNDSLKQSLEKLSSSLSPKKRLHIENKLTKTLSIDDITAIEFYAAVNAQNLDLNYSLGRILDYLYSKHWANILANEHSFRLYLLKMQLFQNFGGFGVCKKYKNKIDYTNSTTINLLNRLNELETNPIIKQSITNLLAQQKQSSTTQQLVQFLAAPKGIKPENLKKLPPFGLNNLPEIVRVLFQQEDKKAIKNIGDYLKLYASIDMVPQLFETSQKQWTNNKNAGKALVKVLETVYGFSFSSKQQESILKWWDLWRTNPKEYTNWSKILFQQQLDKISSPNSLTINDINKITQSDFYEEKYRIICLKSLRKIKRSRTIYRLEIEPKVSLHNELSFFENINFSYKELDNLCKIFLIDAPDKLLDFILKRIKNVDATKQSSLFNNLFRQQWFINHVTKGKISSQKTERIKTALYRYLSQSTFLTEFEEQNTQLNIIQLENAFLSLKEKLVQIAKDSLNESIRYQYLNSILSRMEFHEIIIAFPIVKDIKIANKNLLTFFNRDFGLPIFNFQNIKEEERIFKYLENMTEYEFYEQSLLYFGLSILNKDGTLNFQNIYHQLEFDLVVPFIGEGGKYRDFHVYGLVKVLELHFNSTLGFHSKLNENQIFYTFNSYKRVEEWKKYLIEHKLAQPIDNQSFN